MKQVTLDIPQGDKCHLKMDKIFVTIEYQIALSHIPI